MITTRYARTMACGRRGRSADHDPRRLGFCRRRLLCWCERNEVKYVIGLAKNKRLNALAAESMTQAQTRFEGSGEKQRGFAEFRYAAGTWPHERRAILRYEHGAQGSNPRDIHHWRMR